MELRNGEPRALCQFPFAAKLPTGMEMLRWLDRCMDAFNGDLDQGPKHSLYHLRAALPRRGWKYEAEDLNDAFFYFEYFCEYRGLNPSTIAQYLHALEQGVVANDLHPDDAANPLQAPLQLRVRCLLAADPSLPAPLPEFPLALLHDLELSRRHFKGGSEAWTRSSHESANWAKVTLLEHMEEQGWFNRSLYPNPLEPSLAALIDQAHRTLLARHHIFPEEKPN